MAFLSLFSFSAAAAPAGGDLLLDDFSDPLKPAFGSAWEGFTDQVMGGISEMRKGIVFQNDEKFLRMEGQVRLENRGGFIQVRLGLKEGARLFDAREWTGVRLVVRGLPGTYTVHLRTSKNWFPWSFYTAPLPVTPGWTEVRLPFTEFTGDYGARGSVNPKALKSLAVVAIGTAFDARLDVKEIWLYR